MIMREFGFENEYGTSFEHDIRFLEFPVFDYGHEVIESVPIPGKAGTLTVRTGKYTDTIITNVIEFACETLEDFEEKADKIRKWISKSKRVKYSDKEDNFFVVKKVEISGVKRKYGFFGNITFVFTCDTFSYFESGIAEISVGKNGELYNIGLWSQPIYIITGEGVCTLTVNGKSITANVAQNLTVDTERMISYREDGTLQNTAISGNYEDLYLQEGENTITVSDGFECKVIPRWRCL